MRQPHEFVVKETVLTQTSDRHAHTAIQSAIQRRLRAVVLLKIRDKLRGCVRKLQFLRQSSEFRPCVENILAGRLFFKFHEHGGSVPVGDGNADTLGRDERSICFDDHAVFNMPPDAERLLL